MSQPATNNSLLRRLLVQYPQLDVVAVEPVEAMIGGFRKVLPNVPIILGAAQQLPFDDNSLDAIFVGQVTAPSGLTGPLSTVPDLLLKN